MNHLIVLAGIILAVVSAGTVKDSWTRVHSACQSSPATHVDESVFDKLKRGENVNLPANFGLHAYCMLEKMQIVDNQGNVKQSGVRKAVQESVSDSTKANQIVNECSVNKATKEQTALGVFKCFGKNRVDIGQF